MLRHFIILHEQKTLVERPQSFDRICVLLYRRQATLKITLVPRNSTCAKTAPLSTLYPDVSEKRCQMQLWKFGGKNLSKALLYTRVIITVELQNLSHCKVSKKM